MTSRISINWLGVLGNKIYEYYRLPAPIPEIIKYTVRLPIVTKPPPETPMQRLLAQFPSFHR